MSSDKDGSDGAPHGFFGRMFGRKAQIAQGPVRMPTVEPVVDPSKDARIIQHTVRARRALKMDLTLTEAALFVQARWRGFKARSTQLNMSTKLHLGYELHVLKLRAKRRSLLYGFFQHVSYMTLLIVVFMMQHGHTVSTRYTLVETLKTYVRDLSTPSGVTFDSVGSVPQIWDWTENAFFREISGSSASERVFLRTYNQVLGSVRLQTVRVTDDSCAYKHSSWATSVLQARRPVLYEAESHHPECFGPKEYGADDQPFGPWQDTSRWVASRSYAGEPRYAVDLGKDPVLAIKRLKELRVDGFFSRNTRRATISFTVFNNALPMYCFMTLVFDVSPTGQFTSFFKVEAMNLQEYMGPSWWLQMLLEATVIVWTLYQLSMELGEIREGVREEGLAGGVLTYMSNGWNMLDWIRIFSLMVAAFLWLGLVFDTMRDVDLDTLEFVDLEDQADAFRYYNLLYNVVILCTLFSMLQYTGLDDKMAMLINTIYNSIADLLPFMIIFLIFVMIFAVIGCNLYGPVLEEWSHIGKAVVTALDIIVGNYQFIGLEEGLDKEDGVNYFVAVFYYYTYFFLMMLITMNIVIAILMDGYASVKDTTNSTVEEQLKYNLGPLLPGEVARMKRKFFFWRKYAADDKKPWKDEKWILVLTEISEKRKELGLSAYMMRIGQLVADINAMPVATAEDVPWQVKRCFQERTFKMPSNIHEPFQEPDVESEVKTMSRLVQDQDMRIRRITTMLAQMHERMVQVDPGFAKAVMRDIANRSVGSTTAATSSASSDAGAPAPTPASDSPGGAPRVPMIPIPSNPGAMKAQTPSFATSPEADDVTLVESMMAEAVTARSTT